jgi:hypothetical protein
LPPVLFLDEAPELREISEEDWEMIEHLAELSNQRGDVYTSGTVTASRAMQICEMPGAAILSIVVHLAYLRRDDLVDSLEVADLENLLTDEILKRKEYDLQRLEEFQGRQQKRRTPRAHQRRSREQMDQAWAACLADPRAAVERMRAVIASHTDGHQGGAEQDLAMLLGVGVRGGWRGELQAKQLQLVELAEAAVDPLEALAAEAMGLELDRPTTMASLATWEARGREGDWRQAFRLPSDFLQGPQAVALIAGAVGVPVEEVHDHWTAIARRCNAQGREVAAAWADPQQLLADAVTAGGWEALAVAAGVTPDVLQRHYKQLTDGPVLRPG